VTADDDIRHLLLSLLQGFYWLDEGLQILRTALTQEEFSFDGAFHTIRRAAITPRPVQRPHPPIRLAANSPETIERAGWLGSLTVSESFEAKLKGLSEPVRAARIVADQPAR